MKKIILLLKRSQLILALLLFNLSFSQNSTLSGVISDTNGNPISGANITIQNTEKGTSTSFDGSYVGYITEDSHYDLNRYETRVMNWYGPQNGQYFQEIINSILTKNAPIVKQPDALQNQTEQ